MNRTLFDPPQPKAPTLREKAIAWIEDNPQAYQLFKRFALQMAERGRHFGIGQLAERVRWECNVAWTDNFKINNNYRAYIARELVREHPELDGLITFRKTKA